MDDQQQWNLSIAHLNVLHAHLAKDDRNTLAVLLARYRIAKETLSSVVAEVDSASICRECRGQCCYNGKYRITVLDALAHIAFKLSLFADFSQKPLCPYGSETGCAMEPGVRPADCVVFICDELDQMLSPQSRSILAAQECELRKCIDDASRLIGENMGAPLLLWAERKSVK